MENDVQLKLQAYLDGELSGAEAKEMAEWLARDPEAGLLHQELANTRQAMAGAEMPMALPESREFFWSKIQREISRLESTPAPKPRESVVTQWRRLLVPISAAAVLGIVVFAAIGPLNSPVGPDSEVASEESGSAFVFRDDVGGSTLVWLSYPAENDVADDPTANNL